jgi:hypothetical protein
MIRLDKAGLADYLVVPVHDEAVFSFPKETGAEMAAEAASCMEDRSFRIPLTVEVRWFVYLIKAKRPGYSFVVMFPMIVEAKPLSCYRRESATLAKWKQHLRTFVLS